MRYFFDVHDGERFTRDEVGTDYATRVDLQDAAMRLLPRIAADIHPLLHQHVVSVRVRDEAGIWVFFAALTLIASWMDNAAPAHALPR